MKKILSVIVLTFLALVLVSCGGGGPVVDYLVVSPEKITYNQENSNETFTEGNPRIDPNTVNVYAVMSDGSVQLIEEKTVRTNFIGDGIYEAVVSIGDSKTVNYNVYTYNSESAGDQVVAQAIKFNTTNLDEIASSLVTILANEFKSEFVSLILAKEDGSQEVEEAIFDMNNFDMFKHTTQTLKITSESSSLETNYKVKVVKPADNSIPIRTEYANFWDWVFIIPVAFVMQFFAGIFFNSFAIGILIATIIVRTLAWPIYAKSNDLSLRMSIAQPEMNKIQEKYATRQDPASKQKMQLELMQVYKKHKISIMGCFTPLLQMPIFLAMYQVVHRITQPGGMYTDKVSNTNFLWMDLAKGGELTSSLILAILVGATMFLLQKVSTARPDHLKKTGTQTLSDQQAQQQKTMKIVNIVMIGFMTIASFSYNALALYWLIGNLYSLGQTLINRKLSVKRYEKMKNRL